MTIGAAISVPTATTLTLNGTVVFSSTITMPVGNPKLTIATGAAVTTTGLLFTTAGTAAQLVTLQGNASFSPAAITMTATGALGTQKITCDALATAALIVSGTTAITGSSTGGGGLNSIDFTGSACTFNTGVLTLTGGGNNAAKVIMDTGAFASTTGLVTLSGNAAVAGVASLTSNGGQLNIGYGLTFTANVQSQLITTAAATIQLSGNMTGVGTFTFVPGTIFQTSGTAAFNDAYTLPANATFNILTGSTTTLSSNIITISGPTNVTGILQNATGATQKNFTGLVTIKSGGEFKMNQGTLPPVSFANGIAIDQGATSFNATGAITFITNNQSIANGSGTPALSPITFGATTITTTTITLTNSYTGGTVTFASLNLVSPTGNYGLNLSDNTITTSTGLISFAANATAGVFSEDIVLSGAATLTADSVTINAPTTMVAGAKTGIIAAALASGLVNTGVTTLTCTGIGNQFCGIDLSAGTNVLTVTTLSATGSATDVASVLMSSGTFTSSGLVTLTGAALNPSAVFTRTTGIMNIGAGLTFAGTPANAQLNTLASTINLTGTMTGAGTLSIATATFKAADTVVIDAAYTLPNLEVVTNTTTMNNYAIIITGATTIDTGGTLTNASGAALKTFTGLVTVNSGGFFLMNVGTNPALSFGNGITSNGTTFDAGTGTATFTADQTLQGSTDLTFGGAWVVNTCATVTVSRATSMVGLTLNAAGTANGVTISSGITLNNTGTTTMNAPTAAVNSTLAVGDGAYNSTTITINGGGTASYNSILSLNTGTITVNGDIICNTANIAQQQITFTGAGLIDVNGNFASGSNACTLTGSTGKVKMTASAADKILGNYTTYYDVEIATTSNRIITTEDVTTITHNLTITSGTLDISDDTLTITGTGTPFTVSGTFTTTNSTVVYSGNGDTNIAATAYNNLTFSPTLTVGVGNIIYTAGGAISMTGTLDLYPSGSANSLTFTLGGALTGPPNITIRSNGSNATSVLDTKSGLNHGITAATIDIQTGGTLTAQNSAVNVAGDWTNNGIFTAGNSMVTLNGSALQTLLGTMTSGSSFYNLIVTNASDAGVAFDDSCTVTGTFTDTATTHNGTLTFATTKTFAFAIISINGTSDYDVIMTSDNIVPGTPAGPQWLFNVSQASPTVSYVTVYDSNADDGNDIDATTNCHNGGNNTASWIFALPNTAPAFDPGFEPWENPASTTSTPTNMDDYVIFKATATDSEGNGWYLAICKGAGITPGAGGGAPTCNTDDWVVSSTTTTSGVEITLQYQITSGETLESYDWYAFVCDKKAGSALCSPEDANNQGSGDGSGSPFEVNHDPAFTLFSDTSPINPDGIVTFNTTSSDSDTASTVTLYVCKSASFTPPATCNGGAWCNSSAVASDPSCSYDDADNIFQDKAWEARGYIIDDHGLVSTDVKQGFDSVLTVNNVAPSISPSSIQLLDTDGAGNLQPIYEEAETTDFLVNFIVTDYNSCLNAASSNEISSALLHVYRSGVGQTNCDNDAEDDTDSCYANAQAGTGGQCYQYATYDSCTGASDATVGWRCEFPLNYNVDPTVADHTQYPAEKWLAAVIAGDDNNVSSTVAVDDDGNDMDTLVTYDLNTGAVGYGNVAPDAESVQQTITFAATGNVGLDAEYQGTDMCNNYPTCNDKTIGVSQQKYDFSSGLAWSAMTYYLTSTAPIGGELNCLKTTHTGQETKDTYFKLYVPAGQAPEAYTGIDTFVGVEGEVVGW